MGEPPRIEKLIRDRIPERMDTGADSALVRALDDAQIRPFAARKVLEEAWEVFEAFSRGDREAAREELADLLEVAARLASLSGLSWDEVEQTRREKALARGAFERNLVWPAPVRPRLRSNPEVPLLPALEAALATCTSARFAVAFVMCSGIRLLLPALSSALARGASIRILTSDYLDVTEPDALEMLARLEGDLALRAFAEAGRSYHPKAYLFEQEDGQEVAFVGSSNLSASALLHGVEWNYEIQGHDRGAPLAELRARFDALFASAQSRPVDAGFIAAYRGRRQPRAWVELDVPGPATSPIKPRPAQLEALAQLELLREQGEGRGLVIAATGIGKTYLAAFDSRGFARVLFIAHRDELLEQAHASFQHVRPDARAGFYRAGEYGRDAEVLFASVSTLARPEHYRQFAPDAFDYIVVDEFHHAAADSYRTLLHYFAPRFLLGLTATPYRGDNRDVFALCDGNVAYKVTFMEAIAFGWLCPFRYHGLFDETDYGAVPRRSGRYDVAALEEAVETEQRAAAILSAYRSHPSKAAVGFCVSIRHARFMAEYFSAKGIPAQAVHSGPDAPDRGEAIARLRSGELAILFTVDLFNEGVDIPEIDLVLFLRPTESVTIFLQQLGRGLRLHPGKAHLTVLDFIGNYHRAHYKLPLIAGRLEDEPDPTTLRKTFEEFKAGTLVDALPPGVTLEFDWRAIDLMQQFARKGEPRRERLIGAYREVVADLGRRPTLLELHRHGRHDVRHYRQEFGSWFRFLASQDDLKPEELNGDAEVGEFLVELEKTPMTKSYKMVLLSAFVANGGLEGPVAIATLTEAFRAFFVASRRHRRDLTNPEIAAIESVGDEQLRDYLERHPINAWTNAGKSERRVYFRYDAQQGLLSYTGPQAADRSWFEGAVHERIAYRLAEYFEVRFERKNVFKVINAGESRGIIMLGNDESSPIPRNGGWKVVQIEERRLYAKFAKIAINVLKETPSDSATEPNLLTTVLEDMFGPQGYQPERGNQVRIYPLADEPDVWVIEPHRRGPNPGKELSRRIPAAGDERTATIPQADATASAAKTVSGERAKRLKAPPVI